MISLFGTRLKQKAMFLMCLFFLLFVKATYSQDQKIADSLTILYESGKYRPEDRLRILYDLSKYHPDPDKVLIYSYELLDAAGSVEDVNYQFNAHLEIGNALRQKGNIPDALKSYFKASEIASNNQMMESLGKISSAIGDAYSTLENHSQALKYYNQAIEILRKESDSLGLGTALLNKGYEYFLYDKLDSALISYNESGEIFKNLDYQIGIAYNLGNVGLVHAKLGEHDIAETDLNEAIQLLSDLGDSYAICEYLLYVSDIYLDRGENLAALNYAKRSLELSNRYGLKEFIRDANLKLSELYEELGQLDKSMAYLKSYNIYRDSVNNNEAIQAMAELRTEYEVAQKQAEVDILVKESEIADLKDRRQRWVIFGTGLSLIFVAVLAVNAFRRYKFVQKTNIIIEEEKNKSDNLLLNILPHETASELKEHGSVKAKKIEEVTVLFTDFVEFTRLSEQVSPEQMVRSIDHYFKKFDEVTTRHNMEKIKTIGDSYMCAGGLHSKSHQASEVLEAALEMLAIIKNEKESNSDLIHFDIRIGVHTGPVVAGIVGTKKWQFDIWGDTVNIASGMESNSIPGKINISETTHEVVKEEFQTEFRGIVEIKNRGSFKMYFVG